MTEGAVLRDGVLQASKNSRLPCRREFFRFSLLKTPAAADIILARWHGKEMDFLKA